MKKIYKVNVWHVFCGFLCENGQESGVRAWFVGSRAWDRGFRGLFYVKFVKNERILYKICKCLSMFGNVCMHYGVSLAALSGFSRVWTGFGRFWSFLGPRGPPGAKNGQKGPKWGKTRGNPCFWLFLAIFGVLGLFYSGAYGAFLGIFGLFRGF